MIDAQTMENIRTWGQSLDRKNPASGFRPGTTQDTKTFENTDWRAVGFAMLGKSQTGPQFASYVEAVRQKIIIEDEGLWEWVEDLYFKGPDAVQRLSKIHPDFACIQLQKDEKNEADKSLKAPNKSLKATKDVIKLLTRAFGQQHFTVATEFLGNPIESILYDTLHDMLHAGEQAKKDSSRPEAFIPGLAEHFSTDLKTLIECRQNEAQFIDEVGSLCRFYVLIYGVYLGSACRRWSRPITNLSDLPPVYFVLDSEKVSTTRHTVRQQGLTRARENSLHHYRVLFPTALLQGSPKSGVHTPTWRMYRQFRDEYGQDKFKKRYFARCIFETVHFILKPDPQKSALSRDEVKRATADEIAKILTMDVSHFDRLLDSGHYDQRSIEEWMSLILGTPIGESKSPGKWHIPEKQSAGYLNLTELKKEDMAKKFAGSTQSFCGFHNTDSDYVRQARGDVMMLPDRELLLLTSLIVEQNSEKKVRLPELIDALGSRGVALDSLTKAAVAKFFEDFGNFERQSDSGDAFYVLSDF